MESNKIYHEDCLQTLSNMDDGFLDLTVTSPPYNVDLGNNKFNDNPYDLYDDKKEHKQYLSWLKTIFELVFQKTKHSGRLVINVGDGKNGSIPTHSDIIQMMQEIGWKTFTTIVWDKNTVGARTAWGSYLSPSNPSFPTPFEYIMVFYKGDKKLQTSGETDLTKEEFIQWSLAKWTFTPETHLKEIGHPAAFPIELPIRCIKMLSWVGAIVYDPFMGSGTTALACIKTKRNFIGSEISEQYVSIAEKRIAQERQQLVLDF